MATSATEPVTASGRTNVSRFPTAASNPGGIVPTAGSAGMSRAEAGVRLAEGGA